MGGGGEGADTGNVWDQHRQHRQQQVQAPFSDGLYAPAGLPAACTQASPSKASPAAASPQSSWALRALKQNSPKQTDMLEALLKQHLQKQMLLAGNPVIVPVLGHKCAFRSGHPGNFHSNLACT